MKRLRTAVVGRWIPRLRAIGERVRDRTRRLRTERPKTFGLVVAFLLAQVAFQVWFRIPPDLLSPELDGWVVREVTGLYPVEVRGVVRPRSTGEVVRSVRSIAGPLCVGGGRFSMGGQTASETCTQLDLRRMDDVLELDRSAKTVRVEAGITWRALQDVLDRHDLSVRIMQTYSSFTVGGSLSVNVHGRYVGEGPLVRSVASIRLVLADGQLVTASPTENAELFYGAIGGYGALGVIVEATLRLADNTRIERVTRAMPVRAYRGYFDDHVRNDRHAVFHNGDLDPPHYDVVQAITWRTTERALTETRRLQPRRRSTVGERLKIWIGTESYVAKWFRERVLDPIAFEDRPVVRRNFEASYDARELEPFSRDDTTYVLQEYFVPVTAFERYVPRIREILVRNEVNALNLSIRHAHPDPGTVLAWARQETFAFVLYYAQGTDAAARREVARWTRELVDATVSVGGSYYLPYQPHATDAQFRAAYPGFDRFVALKRRVDPAHRFRNRLLDRYLPPSDPESRARARMHRDPAALRGEEQTFLTLPEWYIVFAANEYATHLGRHRPSSFPYLGQVAQYWQLYRRVYHRTRDRYPWNSEYHTMIGVIGVSFSAENLVKALYENTLGRLTELFADVDAHGVDTPEDRLAARVASEYDRFVRIRPWYEFSFARRLSQLWGCRASEGSSYVRSFERRIALSLEYGVKTVYASLIEWASHSAYGTEETTTTSRVVRPATTTLPASARSVAAFGEGQEVVAFPRYEAFGDAALTFAEQDGEFREIAGNPRVSLTLLAPVGRIRSNRDREIVARWPVLTDPSKERVLVFVRVNGLASLLRDLDAERATLDHVFDF